MPKLQELRHRYLEKGVDDVILDFYFKDKLGMSNTQFIAALNTEVNQFEDMTEDLNKLVEGQPVQYVLGHTLFAGRQLTVNSDVLIPRMETEQLMEIIYDDFQKNDQLEKTDNLKILDIGTGSGAIAITLAKSMDGKVTATDISRQALLVSTKNAQDNHVEINFVESDLLDKVEGKFDIVVSNPPYIPTVDSQVDLDVDTYEPHLALYAGDDGLDIYRRLIPQLQDHLRKQSMIYFEMDYRQGQAITQLIKEHYPKDEIQVLKDFENKDRFIRWTHSA